MWLGANDISISGTWRWASPAGNDGDQFWSGGPTGSPVGGLFSNWAQGAPGSQTCSVLLPFDGHWADVGCNESLGYVCGFQVAYGVGADGGPVAPGQPPGIPDQPPDRGPCIPEPEAGLPDSSTTLQSEILAARDGGPFLGAAANPPANGSTCNDPTLSNGIGLEPDAGIGCDFVNVNNSSRCVLNSDCPAGFLCRETKLDAGCTPPSASPGTFVKASECGGIGHCGQLLCRPNRAPCDEINVCNPGTTFDAGLDDASTLAPRTFNPASLFDSGVVPDAGPSPGYSDPSGPQRDTNHPWCFMHPQDPNSVQNASVPNGQLHGRSSGSAKLNFNFDPDLVFDVQANPIALGETQLKLHAKGSLRASFALNGFLGENFQGDILDASIGIAADRCSLNDTADTTFQVFGLDAIDPFSFGIPKFDTNDPTLTPDLSSFSKTCSDSVGQFLLFADRAKKAFRDGQQLLQQYYSAQALGKDLGHLCQDIGVIAANVPNFPGGDVCYVDETPEFTINRFLDFYQLPGAGAVTQLRDAETSLSSATAALKKALQPLNINAPFGQPDQQESQTIISAAFAIGPVPMVLQIDVFAGYGVPGNLQVGLDFPISLDANALDNPMRVAGVEASVVPHADAGLSAFVGAGFDLGGLSVELGIEGAVTLADIKLPVFAGAELDELVTQDFRPLPPEVAPPIAAASGLTQFGVPTAFKFFVKYDYGIRLDITQILGGTLNAKLHIDFLFFSRTWRKQIVKFNGFQLHQDIVSGGSDPSVSTPTKGAGNPMTPGAGTAKVAGGSAPMGRAENQVPLMVLGYLPEITDGGREGSVQFDAGDLQRPFYDDLCCSKQDQQCSQTPGGTPQCCPGFSCVLNGIVTSCQKNACANVAAKCTQDSDCCSNHCASDGTCSDSCARQGGTCTTGGDCCPGLQCGSLGTCVPLSCGLTDSPCLQDEDCCSGLTCQSSICSGPIPR
jgi:hypothetical protein